MRLRWTWIATEDVYASRATARRATGWARSSRRSRMTRRHSRRRPCRHAPPTTLPLLTAHCLLLIADCSLLTAHRSLPTAADATAEAISDGWLYTGDIGKFDEDGFLMITDRKKDIIVNSGGDNISPQRIEGFLTLQPEIAQAMVYGDKKPHLVALIVPDLDFVADWKKENGSDANLQTLSTDESFRRRITDAIDRVNEDLSVIERVRRFIVVPDTFTIENEMMTPSLKIRRHIIREKYGEVLEGLYSR